MYETADSIFLVQELCTGGSLLDLMRQRAPLSEPRAAAIFRSVVKAVLHCHQVGARREGAGGRPCAAPFLSFW